jgi:hypothetical protein
MAYMRSGECDLAKMQDIMKGLFGENPTGVVFNDQLGSRIRSGQSVYRAGTSTLDLGKTGLVLPVSTTTVTKTLTTPKHTFYGRPRR